MQIIAIRLTGQLTKESLDAKLQQVEREAGDGAPFRLLVDATEMGGYDADARAAFISWHAAHREQLDRTAVVTLRVLWHAVVRAMAGIAHVPMRAFDDRVAASQWLGDSDAETVFEVRSTPIAPSAVAEARGVGLLTSMRWLRDQSNEREWTETLDKVPEHSRAQLDAIQPLSWYRSGLGGDLYEAYRQVVFPSDREAHRRAMRTMGAFVADDNIDSLYRVTMNNLGPEALFGMLPRLWGRYYRGIQVEVKRGSAGDLRRCLVRGLEDARHVHEVAAAWMERAFQRAGVGTVEVRELRCVGAAVSSNELEFDIRF